MQLCLFLYVSNNTEANDEKVQIKDMGKRQTLQVFSPGSDSEFKPKRPCCRLPPVAHPKSLFGAPSAPVTQGLGCWQPERPAL